MTERIERCSGAWAIGADALQWIIYRSCNGKRRWRPVAFVASSREVLARCMGENGCPAVDAEVLLADLPPSFALYAKTRQSTPVALAEAAQGRLGAVNGARSTSPLPHQPGGDSPPAEETAA